MGGSATTQIVAGTGTWNIIDNILDSDSCAIGINIKTEATAYVVNNTLLLTGNGGGSAWYGIYIEDDSTEVWLDGNNIYNISGSSTNAKGIELKNEGVKVHLGVNTGYDWNTFYTQGGAAIVDTLQFTNQ